MNQVFPFGFPGPTAFYLTMYVATLILHVVFMNYVLAGAAYLAIAGTLRRKEHWGTQEASSSPIRPTLALTDDPVHALLRDWMPFVLSAAITAGVAPLLFIQILYQYQFYTANLLLFHRWMAILPALIIGFYLLYLFKSDWLTTRPRWLNLMVGSGVFICFGFVGWSWTENHLLSLQSHQVWESQYTSGSLIYHNAQLFPRLALWFVGAFPTLACLIGWQIWHSHPGEFNIAMPGARRIAKVALAGLAAIAVCGVVYLLAMTQAARETVLSSLAMPYLLLAIAGLLLQTFEWVLQLREGRLGGRRLLFTTIGLLMSITGTSVVREAIRLSAIDITQLYEHHAEAAEVGGMVTFAAFVVINSLVMSACLWMVRTGRLDSSFRNS